MHIAIILGPFLPVPPLLGGAVEKVHLALADAYCRAGHRVTMISRQYRDLPPDEAIDGVRHLRIPSTDRSPHLLINLLAGLRYARRAGRVLPPADITITNEFFLPLVLPRNKAGKIYVQVGRYPKHQMFLYFRAARLQAVSQAVGDAIARQTPWLKRRVRVIGYAIPDRYFAPAPAAREPVVLYVGRLAREKGIDLLIRAFALLRDLVEPSRLAGWRLRIVGPHEPAQGGDGAAYLAELQALARPLGDLCTFAGPVFDEEALLGEYRQSSIFVYPSLAEFGESFGLAPLEAMAGGCAAIVSDLRCFDDYLADGATGLRFDHAGADAAQRLAAPLARLLTEPALLSRLAAGGREAAARFSVAAIAQQMLADFASLQTDPSPPRQRGTRATHGDGALKALPFDGGGSA